MDLYGQCVQVSITNATGPMDNSLTTSNTATEKSFPLHSPGTTAGREAEQLSFPVLNLEVTVQMVAAGYPGEGQRPLASCQDAGNLCLLHTEPGGIPAPKEP